MVSGCAAEVLKKRKLQEELLRKGLKGLQVPSRVLRPPKNDNFVFFTRARSDDVFDLERLRRLRRVQRQREEANMFEMSYRRRNDVKLHVLKRVVESRVRSKTVFLHPTNRRVYERNDFEAEIKRNNQRPKQQRKESFIKSSWNRQLTFSDLIAFFGKLSSVFGWPKRKKRNKRKESFCFAFDRLNDTRLFQELPAPIATLEEFDDFAIQSDSK